MRLLIPAYYYSGQALVQRVWGWSPVEESVFLSLFSTPNTIGGLAEKLTLSEQVASACVTRLMQFGLLEFQWSEEPSIIVSGAGKDFLNLGKPLPDRTEDREIGFAQIWETVGHSLFPKREVEVVWPQKTRSTDVVLELPDEEIVVSDMLLEKRATALLETSLRPGEWVRGIRTTTTNTQNVYVSLDQELCRNGSYPAGTTNELKTAIEFYLERKTLPSSIKTTRFEDQKLGCVRAPLNLSDLILTSEDHISRFENIISKSNSNIFLLSTFLTDLGKENGRKNRERIWQALADACRRGAKCHLFFGDTQNDPKENAKRMRSLQVMLEERSNTKGRVIANFEPVGSHVKILIADNGENNYSALFGSCNWLSSPYRAVELSVELSSPTIAMLAIDLFREIISGSQEARRSSEELHFIRKDQLRLCSHQSNWGTPPDNANAQFSLLSADAHERLLRDRAHAAQKRFVCCSNRVGVTMVPGVLNPAEIAGKRISDVRVYYSRPAGPISETHIEFHRKRLEGIVTLRKLRKPDVHSKFLLWDSDDIVISSMNWASQSGDAKAPYDEIGLHVTCPGIADELLDRFEKAVPKASYIDIS